MGTIKFNLKKDTQDNRDFRVSVGSSNASNRSIVDFRNNMPPVYDQGELNSCTAQAVAAVHQYIQNKQRRLSFSPSRLFLWWNTRETYNETDINEGATLRDTIRSLAKQGICPELMWPYDNNIFRDKPNKDCYSTALLFQAEAYARVRQTVQDMEAVLSQRIPIVFGMLIYQSFNTINVANTGNVPIPNIRREALLGGHAMVIVGFNPVSRQFIVRNSWGTSWGQGGHCLIPYVVILNPSICFDFWVVNKVEDGPINIERPRNRLAR